MSQPPLGPSDARRFLIVMRHAKSDWIDLSLSDHDRPLNERGARDAPRMAQWLYSIAMVPDVILSSTSQRTRETVERMEAEWGGDLVVSYSQSLYLATAESMLRTIRSDGGDATRLMVLGHNPGTAHLTSALAGKGLEMPTAAIAIFQLTLDDWSQLSQSSPVRLIDYMRPKAL